MGSCKINEPNYSEYDGDRGNAETKDVADIMSCYTLTGLPRRHDGALLWTVRRAHGRLLLADSSQNTRAKGFDPFSAR